MNMRRKLPPNRNSTTRGVALGSSIGRNGIKSNGKSLSETPKSDYPPQKVSHAHNPLIDDLLGELGTSIASEDMTNTSPDRSENENDLKRHHSACLSNAFPSLSSDDSASGKASKLAIDALMKASQCFVHTLTKYGLKSYVSSPTDSTREAELRRLLHSKSQNEIDSFVVALLDIIEDVFITQKRIKSFKRSFVEGTCEQENNMSGSLASVTSTASLMRPPVHETKQLAVAFDKKGHRMINRYVILANLGEGSYGKVKLAEEVDTGKKVAIKAIDKQFLQKKFGNVNGNVGSESMLMREITIMKKVRHRNCVSLYEVIDDPASHRLYLIMDYVPNGPVVHLRQNKLTPEMLLATESNMRVNGVKYNKYLIRCSIRHNCNGTDPLSDEEIHSKVSIYSCRPLKEATCALYLRQLVSGLRYMHDRNVVHHDVKPDNILLGYDGRVYLTDFGVSEILAPHPAMRIEFDGENAPSNPASSEPVTGNVEKDPVNIATGARFGGGTLLFTAPELLDRSNDISNVNPYITDIWALGITLHCMLVGVVPFGGNCYRDVCENIRTRPYPWNGCNMENERILPEWKTILSGLLQKDPHKRWSLKQLKRFLDKEEFQEKLRHSADSTADSPSTDAKECSLANSTAVSPASNSAWLAHESKRTLDSKNSFPTAQGFCRSAGISREAMRKVAQSDGVEVVERPVKFSEKTKKIVNRYADQIRKQTASKLNNFKVSDVFPKSEGGITDSFASARASENLLRMHNLSTTDTGAAQQSIEAGADRRHRGSNFPGQERFPENRKRKFSTSSGLSQTQPTFISVANRGSCGAVNGPFQSIEAMLSIVNVQSESLRSDSFSFASFCDVASQRGTLNKTLTDPYSCLDTPQRSSLSDLITNDRLYAGSAANPLGYSSPTEVGENCPPSSKKPNPSDDTASIEAELAAGSRKEGNAGSSVGQELLKKASVSVSSLLFSQPDIKLGYIRTPIPKDDTHKNVLKNSTGKPQPPRQCTISMDGTMRILSTGQKALNECNIESKQVRVSDAGVNNKVIRPNKSSK